MEIEFLNKIKEESEKDIQKVFDELERSSLEFGVDEFNGHKRDQFIIKFDRFEFHLNEQGEKEFTQIRIRIYLENKEDIWIDSLEPIGVYKAIYDINGECIDDFITIESKQQNFGIENWIEKLNNIIPESYYRRNVKEYEFVCYINNTISLFQGRNFKLVSLFIKRSLDYLDKIQNDKPLNCPYINKAKEYLKYLFYYLKNNDLLDMNIFEKYKIEERVKTKS